MFFTCQRFSWVELLLDILEIFGVFFFFIHWRHPGMFPAWAGGWFDQVKKQCRCCRKLDAFCVCVFWRFLRVNMSERNTSGHEEEEEDVYLGGVVRPQCLWWSSRSELHPAHWPTDRPTDGRQHAAAERCVQRPDPAAAHRSFRCDRWVTWSRFGRTGPPQEVIRGPSAPYTIIVCVKWKTKMNQTELR